MSRASKRSCNCHWSCSQIDFPSPIANNTYHHLQTSSTHSSPSLTPISLTQMNDILDNSMHRATIYNEDEELFCDDEEFRTSRRVIMGLTENWWRVKPESSKSLGPQVAADYLWVNVHESDNDAKQKRKKNQDSLELLYLLSTLWWILPYQICEVSSSSSDS